MFNICCDNKIPFAMEAFTHVGNVTCYTGNRLTSADLKCVDLLFIRSGTRVDSSLLRETRVQFVASATAGTDHVDKAFLKSAGIPFYHAPGCNANSVVEYVIAALFELGRRKKEAIIGKKVGIVGVGNVGSRLANRLQSLGLNVVVCDPPLLNEQPDALSKFTFLPLDELIREADIISLHVPLTQAGLYPTYHLMNDRRLMAMKDGAWLINASRGAVVSNKDLKKTIDMGKPEAVVLDVWEGEPEIDLQLLEKVDLGTPHIAGYSFEGKVMGTIMVYEACINHFGLEKSWDPVSILAPGPEDRLELQLPDAELRMEAILMHLIKQMYDIQSDDQNFRKIMHMQQDEHAGYFLHLRKNYPRRRSFDIHRLADSSQLETSLTRCIDQGLGVQIID